MSIRPSTTRVWKRLAFYRPLLGLIGLALTLSLGGCRCLKGPVNDSPSFRWWLFANFGAERICPEVTQRGVGLSLVDGGPKVGRFFPTGCKTEVHGQTQTITVTFWGAGYAYTPVARRVGFDVRGAVELRPDFRFEEDHLYAWAVFNRMVDGPHFTIRAVENGVVGLAANVLPVNALGDQIVKSELARGFTVLHDWNDGGNSFSLGIIRPPNRPRSPYDLDRDEALTVASEVIEIQTGQRDFLGPIEVVDADQAIALRMTLRGPPVEVLVVNAPTAYGWRTTYQQGLTLPIPGPLYGASPIQPGPEVRPRFTVPPGRYWIVVDHTANAGRVEPPPPNLLDPTGVMSSSVARLSYALQLVDE
ncbi:MAG: hypothetical protein AAGA56_23565 [Myxococcota bacterium]